MAASFPFSDAEPFLLTACQVLRARGEAGSAKLLAQSAAQFQADTGYGFDTPQDIDFLVLKLALPATLYAQLGPSSKEVHESAIAKALNEVLNNLEGHRISRVVVVPQVVRATDWRERVLAGEDFGPEHRLRFFELWTDDTSPYEILGIPSSVSDEELKTAWKKRVFLCHEDRNQDCRKAAHEATIRVNAAYDAITNERSRPAPNAADDIPF